MLISIEQIKAARALLRWTQKDLAREAGLNDDQVHSYEAGRTKSLEVLEAIYKTFAIQGIVFTQNGVELKINNVSTIEGDGWYLRLLDDVYTTLSGKPNSELLLMFANDAVSPPEVNSRLKKIRNSGVRMRQLIEEGNTYLLGPTTEYRYIPKDRFKNYVSMIYGDKVAVCTDTNTKAVVFKDNDLAKTWTNSFDLLWDVLKQPVKSDAPESF